MSDTPKPSDGPSEGERVQQAAGFLQERLSTVPGLLLVLGSGLKGYAETLRDAERVPFADVPGWPVPRVSGHGAELVVGHAGAHRVACLAGRVHLYEGWQPAEVVRPLRSLVLAARASGVSKPTVLLTNAAGGVDDSFQPGDLMAIRDHLNLTGSSPLVGPGEEILGPRFPDQSEVYSEGLRHLLRELDAEMRSGVYAGLLGPSYETPAEVLMLHRLGASAVGMSTVHEAMAVNAMGARIAGISLISNLAAGRSTVPLDHQEVLDAGDAAAARLTDLVTRFAARVLTADG